MKRDKVPVDLPPEHHAALRKLERLEYITIAYLFSAIAFIALTMGNSQAMKTAWVDDVLSLAPPITFLVSERIRRLPPNKEFPYGYNRIISIGFLIAATALALMGLYLFIDSGMKLLSGERPSIGTFKVFGHTFWAGWAMMVASFWSGAPAVILGRLKQPLALQLNNKLAYADTAMQRADWLVALTTIVGLVGVGFGWWWADGAAAIFISIEIIKDGVGDIRASISDLIDQVPTKVDSKTRDPINERVSDYFRKASWIQDSAVSLREDGHLFTGDAFIVPKDETRLIERVTTALQEIRKLDWRLQTISITPVTQRELEDHKL